jgi:O-antigen/teichoic acid export membrane protein
MFRRGLLGYLPVNIVQALAGFGAVMVFTRLLSPSDYGAYALAFAVCGLLSLLAFTWIEAAMARFVQVETSPEAAADLFATLYRTFAVAALAAPAALAVLWALRLEANLAAAVAAGILAAAARSLLRLSQERRRALGEVRGFVALDLVQTILGFGFGAGLACLGLRGAAPLAGAGLASLVGVAFALGPDLARAKGGRFSWARLKVYAAYGVPVSLSLMMSLALSTTDRFVLAAHLNEAAVGAYHAGYTLSNRTLDMLFLWLGMAGQPACIAAFERGGRAALVEVARRQGAIMILIALPAAVGLILVSGPLAHVLIGPRLAGAAAGVTPWIALGALFSGLSTHYFNTAFTLARQTRRLFVVIAIPAAANLVLVLIFVPRYGLAGAMGATVASYALGLLASIALAGPKIALPIPWTTLVKAGLATAVMAAAVAATPSMGGPLELSAKAVVGLLVYGASALVLDAAGVRTPLKSALGRVRPGLADVRGLST